jgi:hypothetical protein
MPSRRKFLQSVGSASLAGGLCGPLSAAGNGRKKLAVVTTVCYYLSHAQHIGDRFLVGYPREGKWHRPGFDVVSFYADQREDGGLPEKRAAEFGFTIYPTIAEALRRGGNRLAVDAVLIIGEHGKYPRNEKGQTKYPRYEFFKQVAQVFKQDGRVVPVFSDKHLSWNWDWAKEMVETAGRMKIPFMAGSSLPTTWRLPALDMPLGAEVTEAVVVWEGGVDSYDFHGLEGLQCMVERRRGGETGVAAVQALRGDAVWKALRAGSWEAGGWDRELFDACLSRCQTLTPARKTFNHVLPRPEELPALVKDPVAYRLEYADGLKATMLLLNGLVGDLTFAARLKRERRVLSTMFLLCPLPNVAYSACLASKIEDLFETGRPSHPIERTLLTTGLTAAGVESLWRGQKRIETPHLAVRYQPYRESEFVSA